METIFTLLTFSDPELLQICFISISSRYPERRIWQKFRSALKPAHQAQYCRGKGLFVEQVADGREACQQANEAPAGRNRELREQGKSDRKEIKQLKKDWQRKEQAVAETVALIILRKKPR